MKTLYFECAMGAAGDMLMASLYEICPSKEEFLKAINAAGIPGVRVSAAPKKSGGITGTKISVLIHGHEEAHGGGHDGHGHHHHHHSTLGDISALISSLKVSDKVKYDALAVYDLIAGAESHVHGEPMANVHFHEVGSLDAVADVVGTAMLIELLNPDTITASPIHVGSGTVKSAHGVLPVPVPATALILKSIPIYSGSVKGELCTPTGAALLRHFALRFGPMPGMTVSGIGYGMGTKEFDSPNCVRAFLGESGESAAETVRLSCNLDDMTPEELSFASDLLMKNGALDVWTVPVIMKKGRAGHVLECLCDSREAEKMASLIFKNTSTLGIREIPCKRYVMSREIVTVQTKYGPIKVKRAEGYGTTKQKAEFDDVAEAARKYGVSAAEVRKEAEKL